MRNNLFFLIFAISGLTISCSDDSIQAYEKELFSLSNFNDGRMDGWIPGFARYPVDLEDSFRLSSRMGEFNFGNSESGCLILSGKSWNSDLFMFVKGEIAGFEPDAYYDIIIDVELYSSILESYDDYLESELNGSYLKVGAMTDEPLVATDQDFEQPEMTLAEMDIDIGLEHEGSQVVRNLGKLVYPENILSDPVVLRGLNSGNPMSVKTNSEGKLWLLVGIDVNIPVYQDIYINFIRGTYGRSGS